MDTRRQASAAPAQTESKPSNPRARRFKRKPRRSSALTVAGGTLDYLEVPLLRALHPITDVRCLPFVSEEALTPCGRSFWHCPPSEGYGNDCNRGTLFGAAYLVYRQSHPGQGDGLLGWIAAAMVRSDDSSRGFAVGFWSCIDAWISAVARDRDSSDFERYARLWIAKDVERSRSS